MANHLGMAKVQAIQVLRAQDWSLRRIARELAIDRETVARHFRLMRIKSPAEGADSPSNPAKVITGSDGGSVAEPAHVITGEPSSRSRCEPFRQTIRSKLEQGLSAQRIWQDLREDGFADDYQSVQRFARHPQETRGIPFRRMECAPGQQAQVDFGTGAPVVMSERASTAIVAQVSGRGIFGRRGRRHRPQHLLRRLAPSGTRISAAAWSAGRPFPGS